MAHLETKTPFRWTFTFPGGKGAASGAGEMGRCCINSSRVLLLAFQMKDLGLSVWSTRSGCGSAGKALPVSCNSQNVPRALKLPRSRLPSWLAVAQKGSALLLVTRGSLSLQPPLVLIPHPAALLGHRGKLVPICKVAALILRCSHGLLGSLTPVQLTGTREIYHCPTTVSIQFTIKRRKKGKGELILTQA